MSIALSPARLLPRARTMRRATVVGGAVATAMFLFAGPALAHITVSPDSVPAGSTTVLTFHVPNEESKADTVKVDIQIPTNHPIAQFLVQPVPGWTFQVKTVTLAKPLVTDDGSFSQAVSEVIWSGGKILPGQFQSFTISADPMPTGESQVVFKAIQTYSNGDVVRWIDLPTAGQPDPAHPAPIVTLTTTTAPASTTRTSTAPAAAAPKAASGTDGLGVAGLAVGLLALLLALMVTIRSRRPVADTSGPAPTSRAAAAKDEPANLAPAGKKSSSRQSQGRRR